MTRDRLNHLLSQYRACKARDSKRTGSTVTRLVALLIAEHLLKLHDLDDLGKRDATNPACPSIDAARKPHDVRARLGE